MHPHNGVSPPLIFLGVHYFLQHFASQTIGGLGGEEFGSKNVHPLVSFTNPGTFAI